MNFITLMGFAAATCTTISFIPQTIKTIKTRHTKDLSLGMYFILNAGIIFWLAYGIFKNDLPIILANAITLALTLIILGLKIKYR
jgi:MtN3 and saliva related transmembrane protein